MVKQNILLSKKIDSITNSKVIETIQNAIAKNHDHFRPFQNPYARRERTVVKKIIVSKGRIMKAVGTYISNIFKLKGRKITYFMMDVARSAAEIAENMARIVTPRGRCEDVSFFCSFIQSPLID